MYNQSHGWQQERRTQDDPRESIVIYQRVAQLCEERIFANKQVGPEARRTHKQSRYTNAGRQVKLVQRDPPGGPTRDRVHRGNREPQGPYAERQLNSPFPPIQPKPPLLVTWRRPQCCLNPPLGDSIDRSTGAQSRGGARSWRGKGACAEQRSLLSSDLHLVSAGSQVAARGAPGSMKRVLPRMDSLASVWRESPCASVNTILSLLPVMSMWPPCTRIRPSKCSFACSEVRVPNDSFRPTRAMQMNTPGFWMKFPQRILTEICPDSHFRSSDTASTTSR